MPAVALQARRAFSFVSLRSVKAYSEMPGFIKPQLATLKSKAPKGDQWLHEIKYDGYRIQVHRQPGKEEGLHPQRAGLDQALLRDCRRARYSRRSHHRRRGGRRP